MFLKHNNWFTIATFVNLVVITTRVSIQLEEKRKFLVQMELGFFEAVKILLHNYEVKTVIAA